MTTASAPVAPGRIVTLLSAICITAALSGTFLVPILGRLPTLVGAPAEQTAWLVTITVMTGAIAMPIAGRLADMWGRRTVILIAIVPLIVGSGICTFGDGITWMIVGRALQGITVGIVPVGISLVHDLLPADRVHKAIATLSSSIGVGTALGLPIAAVIAEVASWRALFASIGVLAVALFVATASALPRDHARGIRTSFDWLGMIGLTAALVCLLLVAAQGRSWGWSSPQTIAIIAIAIVLIVVWAWWEARIAHPLVDVRATMNPVALVTNIASILIGMAMFAQSLVSPQILQLPTSTGHGLGQSVLAMGLWMAPAGFCLMLMSNVGAAITRRFSPKLTFTLGGVIIASGYLTLTALLGTPWGVMLGACVISSGVGFAFGAMPVLIMAVSPVGRKSSANAFNSLVRVIGQALASAIIGAVLAYTVSGSINGTAAPSLESFQITLWIGCGCAALAAVIGAFIPWKRATRST